MNAGQQLADLLKQRLEDRLVFQLLEDLSKLLPSLHTTGTISVEHLQSVYHIRAVINERGRNLIQGFEELLPVLDAVEGQVVIHILQEQEELRWLVFSDEAMTQFIGILRLPTQAELLNSLDELSK